MAQHKTVDSKKFICPKYLLASINTTQIDRDRVDIRVNILDGVSVEYLSFVARDLSIRAILNFRRNLTLTII